MSQAQRTEILEKDIIGLNDFGQLGSLLESLRHFLAGTDTFYTTNQGTHVIHHDVELLTSLSEEELEALANSTLAPASQARLDELLEGNSENGLDNEGKAELECLLAKVDQLTIVKTKARYTLRQHTEASGA